MIRMNPWRRMAAAAAIVGVTAVGGMALAAPAMASTTTSTWSTAAVAPATSIGTIALPSLNQISLSDLLAGLAKPQNVLDQSPLPTGRVDVKLGFLKLTFQPDEAQTVQSVLASFYDNLGYQIAYMSDTHLLIIGQKICDDTKSATWNKGCINLLSGLRF